MTIRKMTVSDISEVVSIEKGCFTSECWSERIFLNALTDGHHICYVAERDGATVGYISVSNIYDEYELESLAVREDYRRQGIAKKLIDSAFENADGYIYLEVRVSNGAAISLYESVGFSEFARRKNYYSDPAEDAVLMVWRGKA